MIRTKLSSSVIIVLPNILLLSVVFLCTPFFSAAQKDTVTKRFHIAVFSPLYLDSVFSSSGNYLPGKSLPKYLTAGLEFYEGIQLAIDSLQKEKMSLDVYIYDSRSSKKKLETILAQEEMKKMDMVVGYVNMNEATQLARTAAQLKIPFINVNLPNAAGIRNNPNYIVLNPTLGTHCNAIYKFIQKNYPLAPIFYFRKKGTADDQLKNYFADAEKNSSSVPLKIKFVTLEDTVNSIQLKKFFDSTKTTICIAGSLDANFSLSLLKQLASISKVYKSIVIGMPTWESIDFNKSVYKGIEIIYSSANYINTDNRLVQILNNHFKIKYFSRPGQLVFSGFEILYHFSHVISTTGTNGTAATAIKRNTLFGEIDIQPVTNKHTGETEYFENKKVYFIKKADGIIKGVY